MNWREYFWLDPRLAAWVEKGLITQGQAEAIRGFEDAEDSKSRLSAFAWLAILGGTSIALGVILILSYNWDLIPRPLRAGGFLGLIAAAGICSEKLRGEVREVSRAHT